MSSDDSSKNSHYKDRTRAVAVRSDVIVSARLGKAWTQNQLAERCDLSERLIRRAEASMPIQRSSATSIAAALQIPLAAILGNSSLSAMCDPDSLAKRSGDFLLEVWNKGNLDIVDEHFAPGFSFHHESGIACGQEEMKNRILEFRKSFGEFSLQVTDARNFGSFCVVRWSCTMTHVGQWIDLPATYRRVTIIGSSWVQVVGEKFGDCWDYWDMNQLYRDLADPGIVQS